LIQRHAKSAPRANATAVAGNPMLAPWPGPYGGTPPFADICVADFAPALTTAMAENLAEIEAIAGSPQPPDFDNTLAALERSGAAFKRVKALFDVWSAGLNLGEFQALESAMAPKLAEFSDAITQNSRLFARIEAVHASAARSGLSAEAQRLAWVYHQQFVQAGARLGAAAKARVGQINRRLAELHAAFTHHLLAAESGHVLFLRSTAELAGLPVSFRESAAAAAARLGRPGQWAIENTRSSVEPFLTHAEHRDLRERAWRAFYGRCDGGPQDNNGIIVEILRLRAERAQALGHPTHAHWRLADSMAQTPERALDLMMRVWAPAVARCTEEVADMQGIADEEGAGIRIEPWDYRFFAEKVRKARFDLDMNEITPYLQLEKLREGMFWVAGEIFGLRFAPVRDVAGAHADVRVWEVTDAAGRFAGLWYFDPYARPGKRSGAWESEYRGQENMDAVVAPLVSNNTNFLKSDGRHPTLINWDDAVTLFHEFGHAMHALNSNVVYPSLAGTNVVRDFVELPSQLFENWLPTPQVLSRFAVHFETGEPLPGGLAAKLAAAARFNQGFATVEYLAAALVDMQIHLASPPPEDPGAFERGTLGALGMPAQVVMRHRTPHFAHVFSGDAYSAGYYSYLWAQVLEHDAFEAFLEAGGPFDRGVARRLYEHIVSAGNRLDPAEAYRNFRGRDPAVGALLRARGFGPRE
jgi:peptidyl-dipeptidase Dcp